MNPLISQLLELLRSLEPAPGVAAEALPDLLRAHAASVIQQDPAQAKIPPGDLDPIVVEAIRAGAEQAALLNQAGTRMRLALVQHPAPPLVCQAARGKAAILVSAPYATPVIDGANVRPRVPATEMWALLYARASQTDREAWRNVLLTRTRLFPLHAGNDPEGEGARILYGEGLIAINEIVNGLRGLGLSADTPLTVLAAEMFADPPEVDPLGDRLGHARMLRVSPLAPVPEAC